MKSDLIIINILIIFLSIKNVISLLDFTYPSALSLSNKNVFIVEKEGIFVYDENLENIIHSYLFQDEDGKINSVDILSNVRIVFKRGYIACLVNLKIFFFDYEGKFFAKTGKLIPDQNFYYLALNYIPIVEGDCYYYVITYFIDVNDSIKQRVLYYKLDINTKLNNLINELTLDEFESKNGWLTDTYDFNNMGLSCEYMQCQNNDEYNYLVCFMTIIKRSAISLALNYFEVKSNSISKNKKFKAGYIDKINDVKQIQSVCTDDRRYSLVCLLYTNGGLNCYKFHFKLNTFNDDVDFYSETSTNFNCRISLYGMKLNYLGDGQKISLSCINPGSTVQAIFFNNNLDLIDSITHTQFTQCSSIYGHSIIQKDSLYYVISDALCRCYKRCYEPLDSELSAINIEKIVDCLNLEKCEICGEKSFQNNLCLECNNNKNYFYLNNFPLKPMDTYIECVNDKEKPSNFYFNKINLDYEPCFSTCASCEYGGNYEKNNCTSCDGINYIKNPENEISTNCVIKCRYFYYIENDIYTCTRTSFCPENNNFKIKEKFKCIDDCTNDNEYKYRYNSECFKECPNNTKDDNDFICKDLQNNKCYLTENDINFINESINVEEIEHLVIKYIDEYSYTKYHVSQYKNGNYTVTIYIKNECILDLGLGIPKIEFGVCYDKIKNKDVFINNEIVFVIIDKKIDSKNKKVIKYGMFSGSTGKYLNSDEICKEDKIKLTESIESKLLDTQVSIQTFREFINEGINIFDMSSPFYNDVCFKYNSKKDIALKDRILEYFPNITLCESGCDFIGINTTTITAICECFYSEEKREENLKDKVLDQAQIGFIQDIITKSNIYVLKCVKLIFKKEYIIKCYGVFIILFLIIIEIICTVIYFARNLMSIRKYILNLANKYIDYLNQKNKNKIKFNNNINNNNNKKILFHKQNNKSKNAPPKINKKLTLEKIKSNNHKLAKNKTITTIKKNYNFIINAGKNSIIKNKQNNIKIIPSGKDKVIYCQNSKNHKEFSVSSGKIILPKNKKTVQKRQGNLFLNKHNKFALNIYQYLKTDYNEMDYDEALRKDNRKFCRCFSDRLKDNHILINTFCSDESIKPKSIKIIFFILQLDLYFFINGLFYDEEYVSKIYHIKIDTLYTMLERLFDNLIYATLASFLINYIIEFFFIEEKKIKKILILQNRNILKIKYELIQILKSIKIRYLFFIIFSFVISLLSLFHISCFNIVYHHTMIEWIFFSLFIVLLLQIFNFIICFFQTCLRFISFKFKSEKLFKLCI